MIDSKLILYSVILYSVIWFDWFDFLQIFSCLPIVCVCVQIERCSFNVGVTKNYIFPVKNYHEEIDLNNDMDVLLLSALTNILNFANDYVAEIKKD